ncbi:uncharacterized protein [Watersipora subatra]|uniref:uncharacterized protein n=1 Tax=Watersipora subatra TaxID=2589382 RepID=UPI00355BA959
MNKLAVLSLLIVCAAVAAEARRNRRVEQQVFFSTTGLPPVAFRRRGNGILGGQRALNKQRGGRQEAAGGQEAASYNSLKAGERHLNALEALLQKKIARQERIDAKAERKARRKDAARAAAGERLEARKAVDYEAYEQAEDFNDLSAQASVDAQNSFGMQIASSSSHKEDAAIAESSGSKFDAGTKFNVRESVDGSNYAEEETLYEDEYLDNELLGAEAASEDALNAQEGSRFENEATIDTQNFAQIGSRFEQSGGVFEKFGSNSPFDNLFGKKK